MLRFIDGAQHYSSADIEKKWTLASNASIATGTGPSGINSIFVARTFGGTGFVSKTLDYQDTWIVGFRMNTPHTNSGIQPFASFYALYSGNVGPIITIRNENDNTVSILNGSTLFKNYSTIKLQTDVFYYIELKVALSGSIGSMIVTFTLKVDGAQIASDSFTSTAAGSFFVTTPKANRHVFGGTGVENGTYLNDIYILDGQTGAGNANNDFLGDITILALYPNGDVSNTFSKFPNSGTNFSHINEHTPDYETTYLFANTLVTEVYNWEDIVSFSGTIPGVQFLIMARKDDAGVRTIRHIVNAVESPAVSEYVNMTYNYYIEPYDSDQLGSPWTPTSFNAAQFGVIIKS